MKHSKTKGLHEDTLKSGTIENPWDQSNTLHLLEALKTLDLEAFFEENETPEMKAFFERGLKRMARRVKRDIGFMVTEFERISQTENTGTNVRERLVCWGDLKFILYLKSHISKDIFFRYRKTLDIDCSYAGAPGQEETKKPKSAKKRKLHKRWDRFAERLSHAVQEVRNYSKPKITTWALSFEKLHRIDKIPIPRIREVLNWYCKTVQDEGDLIRLNDLYLPITFSGSAFRQKFEKLENAMLRICNKQAKTPRNTSSKDKDPIENSQGTLSADEFENWKREVE